MKLLINAYVYSWRMTGLVGDYGKWFLGFSDRPFFHEEPRLVSYQPEDYSTCTLNIGGVEHYYKLRAKAGYEGELE